ncbi:MAG TPA: S-layer protein, partial [Planctomycetaceae bacterium]|nr:S-layer protein [Planctomycetaceae bacterium]
MVSVGEVGVHAENSPGSFRVQPQHARLVGNLARLQLQVTGTDERGRSLDFTRDVSYSVSDGGVASVSKTGAVVPLASGTGKILVRHGTRSVEIPVTVSDFLPRAEVSFTRDVMPVLSRSGCNQGTCHGAQFGKGGFKL